MKKDEKLLENLILSYPEEETKMSMEIFKKKRRKTTQKLIVV